MRCYRCGETEGRFFDVISGEGIITLCKECYLGEEAPRVKNSSEENFEDINNQEKVYERLSKSTGFDLNKHKENIKSSKETEQSFRQLVDKKFDSTQSKSKNEDLVDNFHWIIMRARRMKKMTSSELAKELGVDLSEIQMAEKGIIKNGDYNFVQNLEKILGISLFKPEIKKRIETQKSQLGFMEGDSKDLTISDLKEMNVNRVETKTPYWRKLLNKLTTKKQESQEEIAEPIKTEKPRIEFERSEVPIEYDDNSLDISQEIKEEKVVEDTDEKKNEEDLSDDEINDLIFGRK